MNFCFKINNKNEINFLKIKLIFLKNKKIKNS